MENNLFTNKKILITQSALCQFGGSEIVALELANFLKEHNAKVAVFTWFYDEPIKTEFEKNSIYVTTDETDSFLEQNFDFIWVHHQVLPIRFIEKLKNQNFVLPRIYFNHMSIIDNLYIEQPYIYDLEKQLSTKSLFVSQESLNFNTKKYGNIFNQPTVLPNSSPQCFVHPNPPKTSLQKILVVSNHPPQELIDTKTALNNFKIQLDFIGQNGDSYQLITPDILNQYDCIIAIGKTVQYCLTLNIPIYIYDYFGGCGFLNAKNFNKALFANFSGRGFTHKTSDKIVTELINNYEKAKLYQKLNQAKFIDLFSLANNLPNIFSTQQKRKKIKLSDEYINYVIGAETITKQKTLSDNITTNQQKTIENLQNKLIVVEQQKRNALNLIDSMNCSRIVKLDHKIRRIPSTIKNILRLTSRKKPEYPIKINHKEYHIFYNKRPSNSKPIIGLIREKNESLILKDTLNSLSQIVDGFIVLDDNSNDNSLQIAKTHPKCLAVIKHKISISGDRSKEESIHRQLLLDLGRKYNPKWFLYQDADERFDSPRNIRTFLLENITNQNILGIRMSLFDSYMTKYDHAPYKNGKLFNFRKYFGPERRDILMAWKNVSEANFLSFQDLREPVGINENKIMTKFFVQHYGKSISVNQWEETCDYYTKHFPQYAEKWQARKGKGIHKNRSDFNRPLITWGEAKKTGGVKIN